MGNVHYNVNWTSLADGNEDIDFAVLRVVIDRVLLKTPLGAVSITPGREELSYDERTKEYLISSYQDVVKEFPVEFMKNLSELDSFKEKMKLIGSTAFTWIRRTYRCKENI